VVERDNIVVDGAGHVLEGAGTGNGISLDGRSNVTIKNITIRKYTGGTNLSSSLGNTLYANNITANYDFGICLDYSSNYNNISGNNITNNGHGVVIDYSSNNSINGNNITNNDYHNLFRSLIFFCG
jgi:parallel beta-helix repeat protein